MAEHLSAGTYLRQSRHQSGIAPEQISIPRTQLLQCLLDQPTSGTPVPVVGVRGHAAELPGSLPLNGLMGRWLK